MRRRLLACILTHLHPHPRVSTQQPIKTQARALSGWLSPHSPLPKQPSLSACWPQPRFLHTSTLIRHAARPFSPIEQLLLQHCGSTSLQELLVFAHQPDAASVPSGASEAGQQISAAASEGPLDQQHNAKQAEQAESKQGSTHPSGRPPAFWAALCNAMEAEGFKQIATAPPSEVLTLTQALQWAGVRQRGVWQASILRLAHCQPEPSVDELLSVVEGAARAGVAVPPEASAALVSRLCDQIAVEYTPVTSDCSSEGASALELGGMPSVHHHPLQHQQHHHEQQDHHLQSEQQDYGHNLEQQLHAPSHHHHVHTAISVPDTQLARIAHAAAVCVQVLRGKRDDSVQRVGEPLAKAFDALPLQQPLTEAFGSSQQQFSPTAALDPLTQQLPHTEAFAPSQQQVAHTATLDALPQQHLIHTAALDPLTQQQLTAAEAFHPACGLLWAGLPGVTDVGSLLQIAVAAASVTKGASSGTTELVAAACARAGQCLQDQAEHASSALSTACNLATQHARWCMHLHDSLQIGDSLKRGGKDRGRRAASPLASGHSNSGSSKGTSVSMQPGFDASLPSLSARCWQNKAGQWAGLVGLLQGLERQLASVRSGCDSVIPASSEANLSSNSSESIAAVFRAAEGATAEGTAALPQLRLQQIAHDLGPCKLELPNPHSTAPWMSTDLDSSIATNTLNTTSSSTTTNNNNSTLSTNNTASHIPPVAPAASDPTEEVLQLYETLSQLTSSDTACTPELTQAWLQAARACMVSGSASVGQICRIVHAVMGAPSQQDSWSGTEQLKQMHFTLSQQLQLLEAAGTALKQLGSSLNDTSQIAGLAAAAHIIQANYALTRLHPSSHKPSTTSTHSPSPLHLHALLHTHKHAWPALHPQLHPIVHNLARAARATVSDPQKRTSSHPSKGGSSPSSRKAHASLFGGGSAQLQLNGVAVAAHEQQQQQQMCLEQQQEASNGQATLPTPAVSGAEGVLQQMGLPAVGALLSLMHRLPSSNSSNGGTSNAHSSISSKSVSGAGPHSWDSALSDAAASSVVQLHSQWSQQQSVAKSEGLHATQEGRQQPTALDLSAVHPPPVDMHTILELTGVLGGEAVTRAFQDWAASHLQTALHTAATQNALKLPWWKLPTAHSSSSFVSIHHLSAGDSAHTQQLPSAANHLTQLEQLQQKQPPLPITNPNQDKSHLAAGVALNDVALQVASLLAGLPDGTQLEQSLLQALLAASHAPVVQIPTSIHMAKHASRLVHARSRLHKTAEEPRTRHDLRQLKRLQVSLRRRAGSMWGVGKSVRRDSPQWHKAMQATSLLSSTQLHSLLTDLPAIHLQATPLLSMAAQQCCAPSVSALFQPILSQAPSTPLRRESLTHTANTHLQPPTPMQEQHSLSKTNSHIPVRYSLHGIAFALHSAASEARWEVGSNSVSSANSSVSSANSSSMSSSSAFDVDVFSHSSSSSAQTMQGLQGNSHHLTPNPAQLKKPSHRQWLALLQSLHQMLTPSPSLNAPHKQPAQHAPPTQAGSVETEEEASWSDSSSERMSDSAQQDSASKQPRRGSPRFLRGQCKVVLAGLQPVLEHMSTDVLVDVLGLASRLAPCERGYSDPQLLQQTTHHHTQQHSTSKEQLQLTRDQPQKTQNQQQTRRGGNDRPQGTASTQDPADPLPPFYATAASVLQRNVRQKLTTLREERMALPSQQAYSRQLKKFSRLAQLTTHAACSLHRAHSRDNEGLLLLLEELVLHERAFNKLSSETIAAADWVLRRFDADRSENDTSSFREARELLQATLVRRSKRRT